MKPDKPIIIRVGSQGAFVNLNKVVSIGIVADMTHTVLKSDWQPSEAKPQPTAEDYDAHIANTIIFYFEGGHEIAFKEGTDLSAEEYKSVTSLVESLVYEERKPVPTGTPTGTE